MAEYIEREMALKAIDEYFHTTNPDGEEQIGVLKSRKVIRALPAADVEVVKHGRWVWCRADNYKCSNCANITSVDEWMGQPAYRYCPNCGCRMDMEVDNG